MSNKMAAQKKEHLQQAERFSRVFFANSKEDLLLGSSLRSLQRGERTLMNTISTNQKILYRRFQRKVTQTQLSYAKLSGDTDRARDLRQRSLALVPGAVTSHFADDDVLRQIWKTGSQALRNSPLAPFEQYEAASRDEGQTEGHYTLPAITGKVQPPVEHQVDKSNTYGEPGTSKTIKRISVTVSKKAQNHQRPVSAGAVQENTKVRLVLRTKCNPTPGPEITTILDHKNDERDLCDSPGDRKFGVKNKIQRSQSLAETKQVFDNVDIVLSGTIPVPNTVVRNKGCENIHISDLRKKKKTKYKSPSLSRLAKIDEMADIDDAVSNSYQLSEVTQAVGHKSVLQRYPSVPSNLGASSTHFPCPPVPPSSSANMPSEDTASPVPSPLPRPHSSGSVVVNPSPRLTPAVVGHRPKSLLHSQRDRVASAKYEVRIKDFCDGMENYKFDRDRQIKDYYFVRLCPKRAATTPSDTMQYSPENVVMQRRHAGPSACSVVMQRLRGLHARQTGVKSQHNDMSNLLLPSDWAGGQVGGGGQVGLHRQSQTQHDIQDARLGFEKPT